MNTSELIALINRCTGVAITDEQVADPNLTFDDLGVDSLGLMGVMARLEHDHGVTQAVEMDITKSPKDLLLVLNGKA